MLKVALKIFLLAQACRIAHGLPSTDVDSALSDDLNEIKNTIFSI